MTITTKFRYILCITHTLRNPIGCSSSGGDSASRSDNIVTGPGSVIISNDESDIDCSDNSDTGNHSVALVLEVVLVVVILVVAVVRDLLCARTVIIDS